MHELAVLQSIVDTVSEHARGGVVTRLSLGIGLLSGVSPHALQFCFELATRGTALAGAELVVDVEKHDNFVAHARDEDLYAAIDLVIDKAARQLTDFKERLKMGKR